MKIFILDDDMRRIKWFKRAFIGHNVYYAHDPIEAEKMLRKNHYDMIFLDHDLGGAAFVRGKNGDGIDLAKVMARDELATGSIIIVHSLNHHGSMNIMSVLKDTHLNLHRIDFLTFKQKTEEQQAENEALSETGIEVLENE